MKGLSTTEIEKLEESLKEYDHMNRGEEDCPDIGLHILLVRMVERNHGMHRALSSLYRAVEEAQSTPNSRRKYEDYQEFKEALLVALKIWKP